MAVSVEAYLMTTFGKRFLATAIIARSLGRVRWRRVLCASALGAMWAALAFLLGAFVWQAVDEARMRPSKRRRLLRMRLSGLSSREIMTLVRVFGFGAPIPLSATDPCVQALNARGFLRMVPNSDMCGRDSYFFVMDDSLHALMEEFPDTFEDVEWEKGKQIKPFC